MGTPAPVSGPFSLRVDKEDVMTCLIKGCNFVLKNIPHEAFVYQKDSDPEFRFQTNHPNIFPYLLVNIGSGVSIVKVWPGLWKRAGLPQWRVEPWLCVRAVLGIGTRAHLGLALVFMGHRQSAGHQLAVGGSISTPTMSTCQASPDLASKRAVTRVGDTPSRHICWPQDLLAAEPAGRWLGACLLMHLPLFCSRWRQRTGSSGLAAAPSGAAPSGGLGLCSPRQRYFGY